MGDLSLHFSRWEFACGCGCGYDTVDAQLLDLLERVRAVFGAVNINSGARCAKHNAAVGGSPKSQHLLGRAADIDVPGATPAAVHEFLESSNPQGLGLGLYPTFVHVDTRAGMARWEAV